MTITNDTARTQCTVRQQDRFMPVANVIRIMRRVLPPHAKISDDAKETIQECVSEFIGFVTGEANDRCQREQRKTVTAEDVLWAMNKLGFDDHVEPLTSFLQRYREAEGDHRESIRGEPLALKRSAEVANLPSGGYHCKYNHNHHGCCFEMAAACGINGDGEGAATPTQDQTAAVDPCNNPN